MRLFLRIGTVNLVNRVSDHLPHLTVCNRRISSVIGLKHTKEREESQETEHWRKRANQLVELDDLSTHVKIQSVEDLAKDRKFFEDLMNTRNMQSPMGLSQFTLADILQFGGVKLMRKYNNSPIAALSAIFPEVTWVATDFPRVPRDYWASQENRKEYLDSIGKALGHTDLSGWYTVTQSQLERRFTGLKSFLSLFNGSLILALISVYRDFSWSISNFKHLPSNYWSEKPNQRNFLTALAASKGFAVDDVEKWYSIKQSDFLAANGRGLIYRFGDSHINTLMSVLDHLPWNPNGFHTAPRYRWNSLENRRSKFDEIGKHFGVKQLDDWYSITYDQIIRIKGTSGLLALYRNSISTALKSVYPDHDWQPFRFSSSPQNLHRRWDEVDKFIKYAEKKLQIKAPDDWYRVSQDHLWRLGGGQLVAKNGGILEVLKKAYPHQNFDESAFRRHKSTKRSAQRWLYIVLCDLFDETQTEILENINHSTLKFGFSNVPVELDIFLPKHHLAFEYQGLQHYQDTMLFGLSEQYKGAFLPFTAQTFIKNRVVRDREKKELCRNAGITLISIPYWWDGSHSSVATTIVDARPDLRENPIPLHFLSGTPIPERNERNAPENGEKRAKRKKKLISVPSEVKS